MKDHIGSSQVPEEKPLKCLLEAKTFRIHDSKAQPVCHLVLTAVGWEKQRVEAGVASGQLVSVRACPLNYTTLVCQAPNGRTVAACEELEEAALLFLAQLFHNAPQPLYCLC